MHVDVKAGFWKVVDNVKIFSKSVYSAPDKKDNAVINDILKQDFIGGLKASTTVKAYASDKEVSPAKESLMSIAGVLKYTNIERAKAGLQPLKINAKLSSSAIVKADDMFTLQYFEHTSPTGKTAADLVRAEEYDFQSVGENLALGDFGTDQKLVEAWMNSPLHRKNILNPKFTEIGLAVAKGTYKENLQWLAVQHFGRPAPTCNVTPTSLKESVDTEKNALEVEEQELKKMADQIEADPTQNNGKAFLDAYNARVSAYNTRLGALRDLIKEYNERVDTYNACLTS
jgi:uncharacterized protein YkwD